jgi:deazaflavin-dependent oxidoreductase (nitroreductase family)
MPFDKPTSARQTINTRPGFRFSVPRGLVVGTLAALATVWVPYEAIPHSSLLSAEVQTAVYLALLLLTACSRRAKVLLARSVQRYVINPLMRVLLVIRVNPYGLVILETRGHRTGKIRQVPVGNGRKGSDFWIIAEHGTRAGWVRNIQHDPSVRIRLRRGLRYRWVNGTATIRPDEDPLARQRQIIAWHPLRALNAINVRVFGADLLVVHVKLHPDQAGQPGTAAQSGGRPTGVTRAPQAPHDSLAAASG